MLYIETATQRFEISRQSQSSGENNNNSSGNGNGGFRYKFAEVLHPMGKDSIFMQRECRPLEEQLGFVRVVARDLDWAELQWGEDSLLVREQSYGPIKNCKYFQVNERRHL